MHLIGDSPVPEQVGFFHFGKNHGNPLDELRVALTDADKRRPIRNSLIVLPEAFNIGKRYKQAGKCDVSRSVLSQLRDRSAEFCVTFVAGLIVEDSDGVAPPYSSAFLITNDLPPLAICRKMTKDGFQRNVHYVDQGNYTPCTCDCDLNNPVRYSNLCIGAFICVDAFLNPASLTFAQENERRDRVIADIGALNAEHKIVCIPSCIGGRHSGNCGERPLPELGSVVTILANCDPYGMNSFVTGASGIIIAAHGGEANTVSLIDLAHARAA